MAWSDELTTPDNGIVKVGLQRISGEHAYSPGQTVKYQLLLRNAGKQATAPGFFHIACFARGSLGAIEE